MRGILIETRFRPTAKLPRWCCHLATQITKFMGPIWGPPGSCRPQMGPMLAPWTLLSGIPIKLGRKQDCWCAGSPQVINNYVINYVGSAVTFSQGRISTNFAISMLTNARKYKHIYMFPDISLARQLILYLVYFSEVTLNIYLHFMSFLHIDMTQVVEILPQIK